MERHFEASEIVRDVVIGMADGLTVHRAAKHQGVAASTPPVTCRTGILAPRQNQWIAAANQLIAKA